MHDRDYAPLPSPITLVLFLVYVAAQQGPIVQSKPTTEVLARLKPEPEPEDPVMVARGMDILVPGGVANAIRRSSVDGKSGSYVGRTAGSAVLQASLSF